MKQNLFFTIKRGLPFKGLSFIEILISLVILSTAIVIVTGVMSHGLMAVKKGENVSIATNLAQSQFEAYEGNFSMIPFYPGTASGSTFYPDPNSQTGIFVHHSVDPNDFGLPSGTYHGTGNDFYHRAPDYDLNRDGFGNDILEPLEPVTVERTVFIPVVEIKPWSNGFDISEIKHMAVTIYWKERDGEGTLSGLKNVSFEGYIVKDKTNPW